MHIETCLIKKKNQKRIAFTTHSLERRWGSDDFLLFCVVLEVEKNTDNISPLILLKYGTENTFSAYLQHV